MLSMNKKLKQAVVGIAGLGGLGSTVAIALARTGVGRLIITDFDKVEKNNLSRQQYFTDQIGQAKVEAMRENLQRVNPDVEVKSYQQKLNADNVPEIFADADVIAECFDGAEEKQMIVETVLTKMNKPIVVTVSGLAGYGNSNVIRTRRVSQRLIMVGDGQSCIDSDKILTAGRVGIAANHQANVIVEVIVDEIKA
jgi:sulfur carrier protein ThiS adenylyltransferase